MIGPSSHVEDLDATPRLWYSRAMSIVITTLTDTPAAADTTKTGFNRGEMQTGAEAVFWETANTTVFETPAARETFRRRYYGYYETPRTGTLLHRR